MSRSWILRWNCALALGFLSGCLFHSTRTAPPPDPVIDAPPSQTNPSPAPEDDPAIKSNYAVRPRSAAPGVSGAPEERAHLEVKPAIPAAPTPPSEGGPAPLPTPAAGPSEAAGAPSTRSAESAPPADSLLVTALRRALEKHPQEAAQLLEHYDKPNRELLLALVRLTAGLGDGDLNQLSPQELAGTLEQLQALSAALCRKVPLKLDRLCFCRKIESFGQYDPLPAEHAFRAGVGDRPGERVQVYAEVRNFSSVHRNGAYETRLSSTLEIKDLQQRKVVCLSPETVTDRSQSPRQDYFLNFQFHVPARLPPGSYTLWVTVKDVTAAPGSQNQEASEARVAASSLDFRVTAPPAGKEVDGRE
jgi:hypothetical protein